MKTINLMLVFVVVSIIQVHGEMNLVWERSLTNYVSTYNGTQRIKQYTDGSVAVLTDPYNLIVFSSAGDLIISDEITSDLIPYEFSGHSSDPSIISLYCYDNNGADHNWLRMYELAGNSFSVTNIPVDMVPWDSNAGLSSSSYFTVYQGVLRKYLLASTSNISGTCSSGINGSNYILNWTSQIGKSYQIQSSSNLTNWNDVGGIITGTGATLSWANALTNSTGFYRVIEQ